ncbi:hypothetical protein LJC34_06590 [Oscillospiraceae bacterium OttesenSCG-928-G22]|nr:hypothetical protein [Oscillospiraceae bacterium OttesenSCG-928-G22]
MKKTICLLLACILVCGVAVGCRGARNPDGLSNAEARTIVEEKLNDELRVGLEEMFRYIIDTYPGYRYYSYFPDSELYTPETDEIYINSHQFSAEVIEDIEELTAELGVPSFWIKVNPHSGVTNAYIYFSKGEFGDEQVDINYYFDGETKDGRGIDLGCGWHYSYSKSD